MAEYQAKDDKRSATVKKESNTHPLPPSMYQPARIRAGVTIDISATAATTAAATAAATAATTTTINISTDAPSRSEIDLRHRLEQTTQHEQTQAISHIVIRSPRYLICAKYHYNTCEIHPTGGKGASFGLIC